MTTTPKPKRTRKPSRKFTVELGGVRCGWTLRKCFGLSRGILAPIDGQNVVNYFVFGGEKSAEKAVKITARVVQQLRGSMVDELPEVANAVRAGEMKVVLYQP